VTDHSQIQDRLEAYALGALESEERAEVERHLETCADCRAVAAEFERVAHALPAALAAASPASLPSELKSRVLDRLDVPAEPPRRRRAPIRRPRLALAFGALVLVLAVGWATGLQLALARERDRRTELARIVGQQELVLEVVDSGETQKEFLASTDESGPFARSYGKLYTRPDMRNVVAFAARLPRPPEGRAYHLWLTRAGRTRLAGVLVIRDGFGLVVFQADRRGPRYDEALLTLQASGATRPGGARVLSWKASSEGEAS
jgi:hypothetical protein